VRSFLPLAALCLFASPAAAQISNPGVTADQMPQPADGPPPSVADSSTTGTMTMRYALENHTHASKARKGRVLVPANGTTTVTFGVPFVTGAPLCSVTAETTAGDAATVNAQIDGPTTTSGLSIRITRTQQSIVALIGLTVLSVPTQIATYAHYICVEP